MLSGVVLTDQEHFVVAREGHDRRGAGVVDDVELGHVPVRERDALAGDLDAEAATRRVVSPAHRRLRERGQGQSRLRGQASQRGLRASQHTRPWWMTRWV